MTGPGCFTEGPDGGEEFVLRRNQVTGWVTYMGRPAVEEWVDGEHFALLAEYRAGRLADVGRARRLYLSLLASGVLAGDARLAATFRAEMLEEVVRRRALVGHTSADGPPSPRGHPRGSSGGPER